MGFDFDKKDELFCWIRKTIEEKLIGVKKMWYDYKRNFT